jgi:membrane dipeptidase
MFKERENVNAKKSIIVDAHSDIPYDVFLRRIDGERNILDNLHAPRLKKGGINLCVFAIYVEARYKPTRALEIALRQTEALLSDISESSEFMLIKNKSDFNKFMGQDKIGIILAMEGAEPLESGIELFHLFYRLGIRMLGFTWNQRNALADGIYEIDSRGGLTRYGRQVLDEACKLGVILDVTHMAPAGVDDILELATGPVIASHCGAKSVYNHPRNLSDEHIEKIAKTGGVIGVPIFPKLLGPSVPSVETVVDHIEHIIKIAGEEHVGFGADFVDFFSELTAEGRIGNEWMTPPGEETQGLSTASEVPNLIDAMQKRGFSTNIINGVLSDNFLRVFENSLPDN